MHDQPSMGPEDAWASGDAYEAYIGRWSRLVAPIFLEWIDAPGGAVWLDVGCGTGALAATILERTQPREVVGVDPSESFITLARRALADPRVSFEVGDAGLLPVQTGRFDAVVSGLVLNFVPGPEGAVAEMARAARHGATVAAYVWDYAGEMEMLRRFWDAAIALDPRALALDEGRRFPLCRPEALDALFAGAGLADVSVRPVDVPTLFASMDDFWTPFLGGQGPAPSYVASLPEERRAALRERVRSRLPVGPDGAIQLIARAWAVRGRRR
jgi:SAM-dependent methyltransferase